MNQLSPQAEFRPTEIWTPDSPDFDLSEPVLQTVEDFNRIGYEQLMAAMPEKRVDRETGTQYAIFGEAGSSTTDAIVMFNPFANGLIDHKMLTAEFIRQSVVKAGVRDHEGKTLPVVLIGSPDRHQELELKLTERRAIARGDLGPVARNMLQTVRIAEFGRIAVLGFSQGADIGMEAAGQSDSGLDVTSVTVGDPASVVKRNPLKLLAGDFAAENAFLKEDVEKSGVMPIIESMGYGDDAAKSKLKSLLHDASYVIRDSLMTRPNVGIGLALAKNGFNGRLEKATVLNPNIIYNVGYGDLSLVTPKSEVQAALAPDFERGSNPKRRSIEIVGGHHTWGDRAPLLAKLGLKAFEVAV